MKKVTINPRESLQQLREASGPLAGLDDNAALRLECLRIAGGLHEVKSADDAEYCAKRFLAFVRGPEGE